MYINYADLTQCQISRNGVNSSTAAWYCTAVDDVIDITGRTESSLYNVFFGVEWSAYLSSSDLLVSNFAFIGGASKEGAAREKLRLSTNRYSRRRVSDSCSRWKEEHVWYCLCHDFLNLQSLRKSRKDLSYSADSRMKNENFVFHVQSSVWHHRIICNERSALYVRNTSSIMHCERGTSMTRSLKAHCASSAR